MARPKSKKSAKTGYYVHTPEIAVTLQQAFRHIQAGGSEMARTLCQSVLELSPRHPGALNLLGILDTGAGDHDSAIKLLRRAVKSDPNDPTIHHNLATVYLNQDRFDEAIKSARQALALKPDYTEALTNLGLALQHTNRFEEALDCYQKAIEIEPRCVEAISNKANILKYQGNLNEAASHYQQALQLNPGLYQLHISLAFCKRFSQYDSDVRAMESALARPDIPTEQAVKLDFALAKVHEDLGNYDKSFAYAEAGNELKRSTFAYDVATEETIVDKMIDTFTEELFDRHRQHGCTKQGPIFILGMPRSGTTLIEQILASHPDVFGAEEIFDFYEAINQYGLDINHGDFADRVADISGETLDKIGNAYIKRIRRRASGEKFICDKLPHNFLLIGLIRLALPEARIIHSRRDPLDTCISCYMMPFKTGQYFSYDLVELGRFYRMYQRLMNHMRSVIPDGFLDFQYEALIDNQEKQTRKLLDYCGLDWNDACLNYHRTSRIVTTASDTQVRRSLYKSSVRRWKHYEKHLQPLLETLHNPA